MLWELWLLRRGGVSCQELNYYNHRLNIKSEGYHSGITVLSLTFKVITLSRMGAVSKAVF